MMCSKFYIKNYNKAVSLLIKDEGDQKTKHRSIFSTTNSKRSSELLNNMKSNFQNYGMVYLKSSK